MTVEDRRRFLVKAAAAGGAAWVAPTLLSSPAAAQASLCATGVNLVINGDASAGTTNWTPVLGGGVITAAIGPTPPAFEGGGSNIAYASQQVTDLSPGCAGLAVTLSALLRGEHTGIGSSVQVTWHAGAGGTGAALGTLTITRLPTSFATVTANGTVPSGALSFVIRMTLHGHPAQIRGAADNISLVIT